MKVSSPIGDLPFEARRLWVHGAGIELEGRMGAWPARVEMGPADLPGVARLLRVPGTVLAAATGVAVVVKLWHRTRVPRQLEGDR